MGIDISSAFDTLRRPSILKLLGKCGCDDENVRLARPLLSHTNLRVNLNNAMSFEFKSFVGAFQGNCLSGCLFTLVQADALFDHRIKLFFEIDRPNLSITELGLPLDTECADNVDFNNETVA